MMEKLIPFDFEAFKADPSRLRGGSGEVPEWAEAVRDCVVVQWPKHYGYSTPVVLGGKDVNLFRLAAKTRIVRVRLFRNDKGNVYAVTDMGFPPLDTPTCTNIWPWCSDIIEITVTA